RPVRDQRQAADPQHAAGSEPRHHPHARRPDAGPLPVGSRIRKRPEAHSGGAPSADRGRSERELRLRSPGGPASQPPWRRPAAISRLIAIRTFSFSGAGRAWISTVRPKMNRPSEAMLFFTSRGSGFSGRPTELTKTLQSLRL